MKRGIFAAAAVTAIVAAIGYFISSEAPSPAEEPFPRREGETQAQYTARARTAAVESPWADAGSKDAGTEVWVPLDLRGTVVLEGKPVSATVHVGKALTAAGDDGQFKWEGVVDEQAIVWAERGVLRSAAQRVVPEKGRSAQLQLILVQPVQVSGRVLANPDRRPLAGMKVTLITAGEEVVVTDAKGGFASTHCPPGMNEISVEGGAGFGTRTDTVELEAGKVNELEVTLNPLRTVAGKVVDAGLKPVAGATIWLNGVNGGKVDTRSAEDGTFSFPRATGAAYTLVAEHGAGRSPLLMTAPRTDVVLVLAAAAALDVTVTRAGKAVSGLLCTLLTEDFSTPEVKTPTTDAAGKARFEGLPSTKWNVWARVPNARWHLLGTTVTKPGENAFTADFGDDGRRAEIEVVDAVDRQPIEGARVTIAEASSETNAEGKVTFTDLEPKESLSVTIDAAGHPGKTGKLDVDEVSVTVALNRWRVMRGIALDADYKPLRELRIDDRRVDTGADGRFAEVIAGSDLEATRRFSCPRCTPVAVKVPPGQVDVDVGEVVLGEGGLIVFTVKTPDGKPAAFARLYKSNPDKQWLGARERKDPMMAVDALGQARVPLLGSSCIVAWREDFAPSGRETCPQEVEPGKTEEIDLVLHAPAFVEGIVRKNGKPEPGLLAGSMDEDVNSVTDERGRYRIGPLSPGHQNIGVFGVADGLQAQVKPLELAEGATVTLNFGPERGAQVALRWTGKTSERLVVAVIVGRFPLEALKNRRELLKGENVHLRLLANNPEAVFDSLQDGEWTVFVFDGEATLGHSGFTVANGQDQRVTVVPLPSKN